MPERIRLKATVRGAVQGVGFRPFVFRLASELGLKGWVNNSAQGVFLEVEGVQGGLEQFLQRLEAEKPPRSFIQSLQASWLDPVGYPDFEIRQSETTGDKTALVLPDIATCADCLREIFDLKNRRHFYPFTNCTHCGPRFSIIEALPYDRENTSMRRFQMCAQCQAEYEDPRDRRFHAQPNACPACGPQLELWDAQRKVVAGGSHGAATQANRDALEAAAAALRTGKIVAVKGLGGFHLMTAAHDDGAVRRLRDLKHREEKPLAVMFHSLAAVKLVCNVCALEERLLRSPESPIVLLRRRSQADIQSAKALSLEGGRRGEAAQPGTEVFPAPSIAPGNPNLGVLLPYTPLHHLLLALVGFPVVATSGNLSDEPICTDEKEALVRLKGIADLFLVHDRPIVRHVDDSIARLMAGRELVLRRARGYAPLPVMLRVGEWPESVLAVGAHLKNAVALAVGPQVFISQHLGDLETEQAHNAFTRVIADFEKLYQVEPGLIACDTHPGYLSTQYAVENSGKARGSALVRVQHHLAHVLSCMAENELEPPVLGVSWDGTGYGLDETIWGGEFIKVESNGSERVAHLRPFPLLGGEQAIKEPRRSALGLLYVLWGETLFSKTGLPPLRAFSAAELASLKTMLARRLNSPLTSSVGRLFDAVASLAGLRQRTRFEGQAAMELEFALEESPVDDCYPFALITTDANKKSGEGNNRSVQHAKGAGASVTEPTQQQSHFVLDWGPAVHGLLSDLKEGVALGQLSAKFHNGLIEAIISVARQCGLQRVVLSGGCFQNRYLTEHAVQRLKEEGYRPYWHQRVPPNDGGIALGQIAATLRSSSRR